MDWITQAALGALIGELLLGRPLGNRALAWGALFGILPELDIVIFPLLDTARKLAWQRGPSHSLVMMALGSWGIAFGLNKIWKKEKISKALAFGLVFTAWAAHGLADCLTVKGASVLWPLSENRVAFNCLYPVDPLFTAPLVAAVLWLAFLREPVPKKTRSKKPPPPSKRRKLCKWGLGLSAGYALLAVGMKFLASAGFEADLARRGTKYERRMEGPTPYNCLLWRSVVDRGDELWVGYRTVFEFQKTPVRWTVYLKDAEALGKVQELRETTSLLSNTEGWWIARPNAKGAWLGDLRSCEARIWGGKEGMVDSRLAISWDINLTVKGDPLQEIFPDHEAPLDYLQRMSARIFGSRASWEANPRLAGVAGSLPEFLPVED